jgi:hypothetical protein
MQRKIIIGLVLLRRCLDVGMFIRKLTDSDVVLFCMGSEFVWRELVEGE